MCFGGTTIQGNTHIETIETSNTANPILVNTF